MLLFFSAITVTDHFTDPQFGFMKGKGTTNAIFWQMQKFRVKGNKLCFGFVNLEKAFDRVRTNW